MFEGRWVFLFSNRKGKPDGCLQSSPDCVCIGLGGGGLVPLPKTRLVNKLGLLTPSPVDLSEINGVRWAQRGGGWEFTDHAKGVFIGREHFFCRQNVTCGAAAILMPQNTRAPFVECPWTPYSEAKQQNKRAFPIS